MSFETEVIKELEKQYQGAEIEVHDVVKSNVTYRGLTIRNPETRICPTISLESLAERYENGEITLEQAAAKIVGIYEESMENLPAVPVFDRNYILEHVSFRLLNQERNQEIFHTSPVRKWNDLMQVPYVKIETMDEIRGSVRMTHSMMNTLGLGEQELFEACEKNAEPVVKSMFEVLKSMMQKDMPEGVEDDELEHLFGMQEESQMYICTTPDKSYGAGMFLEGNVMEEMAEKFDGDVIILPSSVHECILIPATERVCSDFRQMVHEVNEECVSNEDFLSDNVYMYSREQKQFMAFDKEQER